MHTRQSQAFYSDSPGGTIAAEADLSAYGYRLSSQHADNRGNWNHKQHSNVDARIPAAVQPSLLTRTAELQEVNC